MTRARYLHNVADVLLELLPSLLHKLCTLSVECTLLGQGNFLAGEDGRYLSMQVCKVRVPTVHVPLILPDVTVDLIDVVRLGTLATQERRGYPNVDVRVLASNRQGWDRRRKPGRLGLTRTTGCELWPPRVLRHEATELLYLAITLAELLMEPVVELHHLAVHLSGWRGHGSFQPKSLSKGFVLANVKGCLVAWFKKNGNKQHQNHQPCCNIKTQQYTRIHNALNTWSCASGIPA